MSFISEKVRYALFAKINVSSVLGLASGGVHYLIAPQTATYPLVTFSRVPKEKIYRFSDNNPLYESDLWLVKALTDEETSSDFEPQSLGENILNAVEAALNNSLSIAGGTVLLCRRMMDISAYTEILDGREIYHQGTYFQVTAG